MGSKFTGSYEELQTKLSTLNGVWDDSHLNKKVLKIKDGVMNWFESPNGLINFQGKADTKPNAHALLVLSLAPYTYFMYLLVIMAEVL